MMRSIDRASHVCCQPLAIITLMLAFATVHADADESSDESTNSDSSVWVTSIAPLDSDRQFVAGTATSLLLREADVVSFSVDSPNEMVKLYSHPAAVWCVAATADGKTVASVDYRGNLMTYDTSSQQAATHTEAFQRWCQALIVSPDDQFVVAGNEDGKVMAWNLADNKVETTVELDGHAVTDLAFSPDGKRIAASDGDGHVHLLKWPSLDAIGKIEVSEEPAWSVAFIDDGMTLLIGSGDRKLYRCSAKPDAKPKVATKGRDWITDIAISPSGQIAASEVGGRVLLPAGGQTESMDATSGVWALQWNGDGQLLVGTRKHGVSVAGRSWKWTQQSTEADGSATESDDD